MTAVKSSVDPFEALLVSHGVSYNFHKATAGQHAVRGSLNVVFVAMIVGVPGIQGRPNKQVRSVGGVLGKNMLQTVPYVLKVSMGCYRSEDGHKRAKIVMGGICTGCLVDISSVQSSR